MSFEDLLQKLNENPKEDSLEAVRLLVKITENILKDPQNVKIRTLNKSNPTVSKKILGLSGGALCLKLMGFQETVSSFILPPEAPLTKLVSGKDDLLMWKESVESAEDNKPNEKSKTCNIPNGSHIVNNSKTTSNTPHNLVPNQIHKQEVPKPEIIKPIYLPPLESFYREPFLHQIEVNFHNCLRYANKDIQHRARNLIPISSLEKAAQERLRNVQEHVKKNKLKDPNISIQDMLILELLRWFKEDFFSWVDSPDCDSCGEKTKFSHISTDSRQSAYALRVELHRCQNCQTFTPFARYDDLNILLETRRGRCGEWANTFTLFCYAMGWDARFVLDSNDHVWTEVFSIAQQKWLHCDPCENICDKPLIYEAGWKKKMTYVIAYSTEEVQDVTWKYSSQHKNVLLRRKSCSEKRLIEVLMELRQRRQKNFSEARKKYLTKRLVLELADMLVEKKPGDEAYQGRQSGDEIWRLARGETHEESSEEFVWKIDQDSLVNGVGIVQYSAAQDVYQFLTGDSVNNSIKKWSKGCFDHKNITRKEERDWKQVYLARKENEGEGQISWRFEFNEKSKKQLETVTIQFHHATYENGQVNVELCCGDVCQKLDKGSKNMVTNNFAGKNGVTLRATLSGGKGDVAWQHTQLFRQPVGSSEFPFSISFTFK